MVILTALNDLRCALRPDSIAAVIPGEPTTVVLTSGLSLEVREPADEVQRRLDLARGARALARSRHGRGH